MNFRLLFSSIILSSFAFLASAFEVSPEIAATGMRTLVVETVDGEEPTAESINAPEGSWGIGTINANKAPGRLLIYKPDGSIDFDSGEYEKKESGMTIKVRGNSSARFAKKPFKIKLEKKGDLFCRGDKSLNDKNWALLTSRNNLYELGFLVGEWVGMPWTPVYEYVHLVINDDYRGMYTLVEAVERNESCRIKTLDSGFVAERDIYWWNENDEFFPSKWLPICGWTLKYPDFEDLTPDQSDYIQSVLQDYEAIIETEDYEDLIDIDSVCRWLVAQDILGTGDAAGTNFYLAKYDDTDSSKLFVPVVWDVDSAEETVDQWSLVHWQGMIKPLFENSNKAFLIKYIELYWQLSPKIYRQLDLMAQSMRTDEWEWFDKAAALSEARWADFDLPQYSASHNADDMEWWFPPRKVWLDNAVAALETTVNVGAVSDSMCGASGDVSVFSLEGIPVYNGPREGFSAPSPGIYILSDGVSTRKIRF